jgi:hypothetical protein
MMKMLKRVGLKEDKQKGFFPSEFVQIINPMNPNNESINYPKVLFLGVGQ